jgi:hypothetical protein
MRTSNGLPITAYLVLALRRWVQHFSGQDQVVIKHPVILRTWLS